MNLDDLTRRGLYLSDIPLHDATRDLVLLGEQFREEYKLTQELEILTDRLQHTLRALEDEKKKTDRLDAPDNSRRRTNAFHAGSSARFLLRREEEPSGASLPSPFCGLEEPRAPNLDENKCLRELFK